MIIFARFGRDADAGIIKEQLTLPVKVSDKYLLASGLSY